MSPSDRELLATAISDIKENGNDRQKGLEVLFDLCWRKYFLRYRAAGLDKAAAEDLAGDLYLKFVEKIYEIREPIAAEAWMNRTAFTTLQDYFRSKARRKETPLAENKSENDEASVDDLFLNRLPSLDLMQQNCLRQQMELFSLQNSERWYVLALVAEHGYTNEELSVVIDRTINATKVYLSACRKKLDGFIRQCLE
jgi:DNA-directed RNA polymerase specialized sigma24 family protein